MASSTLTALLLVPILRSLIAFVLLNSPVSACSDHAFSTFYKGQVRSLFTSAGVDGSVRKLFSEGDISSRLDLIAARKQEYDLEEWNYNGNGADWNGACNTGQEQSPLNIQTLGAKPASTGAHMQFGTAEGLIVYNTGYAIQAEWKVLTGTNTTIPTGDMWGAKAEGINRVAIEPLQFHVHSNCEHIVDEIGCQIELHLVNVVTNSSGLPIPKQCETSACFAAFGVKYDFSPDPSVGNQDSAIALLADNVPSKVGADAANYVETPETFNLDSLFPSEKTYINYQGSLTTPPCDEGINWHLFITPNKQISIAQYEKLQSTLASALVHRTCISPGEESTGSFDCQVPYGSRTNNREIMPLNDRIIYKAEAIVVGDEPSGPPTSSSAEAIVVGDEPSGPPTSSSAQSVMYYSHPIAVMVMGGVVATLFQY